MGQNQRQRPRPEGIRKEARERAEYRDALGHRPIRHMRDQRVELRASLGLINARHRLAIGSVGGKPVNRFRGNGDGLPRAQQFNRPGKGFPLRQYVGQAHILSKKPLLSIAPAAVGQGRESTGLLNLKGIRVLLSGRYENARKDRQ